MIGLWRLLQHLLWAGALACGFTSLWLLAQSPFAAPYVDRTEREIGLALDRAMARQVTPEWLLPRLDDALARRDWIALQSYVALAEAHDVTLGADRRARAEAALASAESWTGRGARCAACAWDIAACTSLAQIGACAVPVELTPLGDLNALRRAGRDWATGAPVDRLEVGLATLGLGASGVVLASGGMAGAVKLGATTLRLSHRMGTLTPGLRRSLRAAVPPLRPIAQSGHTAPLRALTADLGQVRRATSLPDTLLLLRHVESAEDAARLARLSHVAGAETRPALLALGKARAFRLLVRLSDLAHTTAVLLAATLAHLSMLALSLVLSGVRRHIARSRRRMAKPGQEGRKCASSLSFSTIAASA